MHDIDTGSEDQRHGSRVSVDPPRPQPPVRLAPDRRELVRQRREAVQALRAARRARHRRLDTGLFLATMPGITGGALLMWAEHSPVIPVAGAGGIVAGLVVAMKTVARWGTPTAEEEKLETRAVEAKRRLRRRR